LEAVRFEKFTLLIEGINKSINKIKYDIAPELGVKSVHVFWIYELMLYPEGLTATEIAAKRMVDKSLVSREINKLKKSGYITVKETAGRNYNARLVLTQKGEELAKRISEEAMRVQNAIDMGITEAELEAFYPILEKLYNNFVSLSSMPRADADN